MSASPKKGTPSLNVLIPTGEVTMALINAANDSDAKVRASVATSLHDIGYRQTPMVVSSCVDWLLKNGSKAAKEHKVAILAVTNRLIEEKRDLISQELAMNTVTMAMEELVMDREVVPELQEASCKLIVSLATLVPAAIMDALMANFQPGVVPHYFVVKTLGDVAAANPTEVVPRLREALSRMNPLLGSLKHDNLKWVFATALWQFCDALQQYTANVDRATDKGVATASFAAEMLSSFEILLTRWAQSGDKRLRLAVLRALGQMTAVFSAEQFEIQAPKVIPSLVAMLRKETKDVLHVTQALCALLEAGVRVHSPCLQLPQLITPVLQTLHFIVCAAPDFSNSPALKNYGEALRCFEVLARGWPETVLAFILGRLEPKEVPSRLGALAVLKHLVVSVSKELEDKKGLLVSGVKPLVVTEANTAVRKSLAQLVVAMASHGYLELEGGETLIEFIVRCCSYEEPKPGEKQQQPPLEVQSSLELRDVCDNILFLAATTIPSMERVLWPYLFELVVPNQYTGATTVVAKALAHVAGRKRESGAEEYWVDFDKHVNLPKPQQLMAKLFGLLCMPNRRPQLGVSVLHALRAIGPILHPAVCDMWDEKIPKLVAYLEDRLPKPEWDIGAWEELVLRLLAESVRIANDDEWAIVLGDAIVSQIEALTHEPYLRGIAMKQLGIVMQRNGSKDFVRKMLEALYQLTNHSDDWERQGCATAYGYASANHLDIVLEKLQQVFPACTGKRSGGGLFGSKPAPGAPPTYAPEARNTVMLSYGYVASYANPSLITSRVEIHIVTVMRPCFAAPKTTPAMRTAIATAITLIAKAMHPAHLQSPFVFKGRDELAKTVADYLSAKDTELDTRLRLSCLEALAALSLLEPVIPEDLEKLIVAAAVRVLTLNIAQANPKDGSFAPGTCDEKAMEQLQSKTDNLFAALLFMQPSIAQLRRLLEYLRKLLLAAPDQHRERATVSLHNLLRKFIQFSPSRRVDSAFTALGETLAMPLPRCTDIAPKVRRAAVECIGLMLYIDHTLRSAAAASSSTTTPAPPECLKQLNAIRDRIEKGTAVEQIAAVEDLATVLSEAVREDEVVPLVVHAVRAMLDVQPAGQVGSAAVVNVVLRRRGKELGPKIAEIVGEFLEATSQMKEQDTIDRSLVAFRTIAAHHLVPVMQALLEEPVPHAENVVRLLQAVARDEALATPMVAHLASLLNTSCLHEEKTERSKVIYCPLPAAMSTTAALEEVLRLGDAVAPLVAANFAQFLCTVLLRVGTCARAESRPFTPRPATKDAKPGKPVVVSPQSQATEAVRQFVKCLGSDSAAVLAAMDEVVAPTEGAAAGSSTASSGKGSTAASNGWKLLESAEKYTQGVTRLTRAVLDCPMGKERAQDVYNFLAPFMRGNYLEQRVVTAVMMAEMVAHCTGRAELLDKLMNAMTEGLADASLRIHVLHGLGNVAADETAMVDKYASTVVDALTPPLNGADEELAMEAITGLSKVFEVVDEERVSPFLVNLCAQIRPSFEKETVGIRAAAFQLFGMLARFGANKSCAERFGEQIHAVLPAMLLHLYDEEESVQKACKYALRRCAPLTGAPSFATLVEKSMFEPDTPIASYDVMAEEISKVLITHFPERVSYYLMQCVEGYRSSWNRIKANAAVMTGTLLGNLPPEKRNKATLNPTIITRALISLLKERNAEVRQKAAEAMSVLYTY